MDPPVDPRIHYPCYMSFDDVVDVAGLRSLDSYVRERLVRHVQANDGTYFQNEHTLDVNGPFEPGVREIWLSHNKSGVPYDYLNLDEPQAWEPSPQSNEFALLMDWISALPFKATGRMLLIYDDAGHAVPAHRDHLRPDLCHEFLWLRTNRVKPFFMLNHRTGEKQYVESYSAWFDTVNQFHGTDRHDGLAFSLRIDGIFNDDLRARIPRPAYNLASAPALWACTSDAHA